MSKLKVLFSLLKQTYDEWNQDQAPRLAAALSYYTVFSIAPFLIVVIAVAGIAFGQEAVQGSLDEQIQGLVGREGADMIQEIVQNSRKPADNVIASVIGVATLLMGAGGVFGQLKNALNTVWNVEAKQGGGILNTIKERFLSFSMVLGVGFLLVVSLAMSTILSLVQNYFATLLPGTEVLLQVLNFVLSFGIITLLFAMIYKVLPDAEITWHDVWIGAAVTALLFTIGKTLLGIYLGNSGVASSYGAAGSLILILLWIFYSSQILLFGAEFTQVFARRYGSQIRPEDVAVSADDTEVQPEKRVALENIAIASHQPEYDASFQVETTAIEGMIMTAPVMTEVKSHRLEADRKSRSWLGTPLAIGATALSFVVGMFIGLRNNDTAVEEL